MLFYIPSGKVNLVSFVDYMYKLIDDQFVKVGWEMKDLGYFEYKTNNNSYKSVPDSWIFLSPDTLDYEENKIAQSQIWFKFSTTNISENGLSAIKQVIKPFYDQDYIGCYCWINPFYPNGYWQNGVLRD